MARRCGLPSLPALAVAWLLCWDASAGPHSPFVLAAKSKQKKPSTSLSGDLGPLHHRTYKPLSGKVGADGSLLLSSAPKRLLDDGNIPAETVALPMECNIERRESITAASFDTEFRRPSRPLMVSAPSSAEGSDAEHFSYEGLKRRYGEEQVTLAFPQTPLPPPAVEQWHKFDTKNPSIIRLGLRRLGLREYMERKYSEADPLYLFARLSWQPAVERARLPDFAQGGGSSAGQNASTFIGVGRSGSGLPFHWHEDSFVEVTEGRVFWSLVSGSSTPPHNPEKTHGQWLINDKMRAADALTPAAAVGRHFCIQVPGEVMYIPRGYWQASFNLEDTVLLAHHTVSEFDHHDVDAGADGAASWWSV